MEPQQSLRHMPKVLHALVLLLVLYTFNTAYVQSEKLLAAFYFVFFVYEWLRHHSPTMAQRSMKYPQLVSMPEPLRTWLEDELEARGIDAFYAEHILKLLKTKHTTEDPPLQEVRRGRKRGRRERVDLDRERRLAAVECLISASDQQIHGIDSLIDELCTKLRLESEGGNSSWDFPGASTALSAGFSQNRFAVLESDNRYSAAFPALKTNTEEGSSLFSGAENSSAWNGKRILGSSFGSNRSNLIVGNKVKSCAAVSSEDKWGEDKENQASKEDVGTNEKLRSRSMVKQQITQKARKNMAKSLDRNDDMLKVKASVDGGKARRLDLVDEPLFAGLLSQFDCGIKSIWSTEKPPDDLDGCDDDLPMDFQQLLDSPDCSSLRFDMFKGIAGINNKQSVPSSSSAGNSFIQCGTNITSSIWSENSGGGVDGSMDCGSGSDNATNNNNSECSATSLSGRSVWDITEDEKGMFRSAEVSESAASMPKAWSNGNNLFPNTPWKMSVGYGNVENLLKTGQWSDVESTSLKIEDGGKFYSAFGNVIDTSLSALNHNKEDSCFTEVVPNKAPPSSVEKGSGCSSSSSGQFKNWLGSIDMKNIWDQNSDDEDLLTSMRTHFQPIGSKEVRDHTQHRKIQSAPKYEDGATFQISNSLEKPNFERSESGAFYLDADKEQKYREFNDPSLETSGDFIPKFKVCQNEKFCQTDEVPLPKDEESFFPRDEKRVLDCVENVFSEKKEIPTISVDGWLTTWPAGIWSNNTPRSWCDVWSADTKEERDEAVEADQYTKLKDELLEEGEELLSNLSSMRGLLLGSDEPGPSSAQSDPKFRYKLNSIPHSSEDLWETNERYLDQAIFLGESRRQPPLLSISARTESAVI